MKTIIILNNSAKIAIDMKVQLSVYRKSYMGFSEISLILTLTHIQGHIYRSKVMML